MTRSERQDQATEFTIRAARDAEMRACRMLMPETFAPTIAPEAHVALVGNPAQIVGAAAVAWRPWSKPPGFPVQIHVVPGFRRRGIARALLRYVVACCAGETQGFHSWAAVPEPSPAASFLAATNFTVTRRFRHFEADLLRFDAMIDAIRARLARGSRIPDSARIVPLSEAPARDVAAFVARTFETMPEAVAARIAGQGLAGYDMARSVVLLIDGAVQGALLYAWIDGVPVIDVNAVAPALRRGWANVALLAEATRNAVHGGAQQFRFFCDERVRDTMNLAARVEARETRVEIECFLSLDRATDVAPA